MAFVQTGIYRYTVFFYHHSILSFDFVQLLCPYPLFLSLAIISLLKSVIHIAAEVSFYNFI